MALYIKNAETEALARELARKRNIGITEVVHSALRHALDRENEKPSLVEFTKAFQKRAEKIGNREKGLPADKDFIDSLYED